MGLDMYLTAKRFFWTFKPEEKELSEQIRKTLSVPKPVIEIAVEAAYWRKANQIHGWFVENVQDGEDQCQPYEVSREQLQRLLDLCKEVKAHPKKAGNLLPPTPGSFFGGETIDDWYWEDIDLTIEQIEPLLTDEYKDYYFEYRSSW